MQLNPARGRKLTILPAPQAERRCLGLCSSTPRGDGNRDRDARNQGKSQGLCSSTPRGDGNFRLLAALKAPCAGGLCSSTPRGDGNLLSKHKCCNLFADRFMQLNPARGRKLPQLEDVVQLLVRRFMQLNPARGRKRAHAPLSGHGAALDSHATTTPLHAQALSPPLTPSTYPVFLWGAYGKI